MPSASHDELELREIAPGYASRFTDWGGITVAFEKAHAGQDATAMVKGLPGDSYAGVRPATVRDIHGGRLLVESDSSEA